MEKWTKFINMQFIEDELQMAEMLARRCSNLLVFR